MNSKEKKLLNSFMGNGKSFTPKQADAAMDALSKLHKRIAHFRLSYKVQCEGQGGLWSLYRDKAENHFDALAEQMQSIADRSKAAPKVVMLEVCEGKEKQIKCFEPKIKEPVTVKTVPRKKTTVPIRAKMAKGKATTRKTAPKRAAKKKAKK